MEGTAIPRIVQKNDPTLRDGKVRIVDPDSELDRVVPVATALQVAEQTGLDLVLVADNAEPPVCRLMNFSKFVYDRKRQKREQRKKQHQQKNKEIKFHANIDPHDYQTKLKHILDFLDKGYKVKVSLYLRGREMAHKDIARDLMQQVIADVGDAGVIEASPREAGRSLIMLLAPGAKH